MVSSTALQRQLGVIGAAAATDRGDRRGRTIDRGELVAGGVGAGHQQTGHQHAQFFEAEAIAVVLDPNQLGDQVVGQRVTASGDHVVDVGVQSRPRRARMAGIVVGDIPAEGLEDVVGPVGEQLPVLAAERREARR